MMPITHEATTILLHKYACQGPDKKWQTMSQDHSGSLIVRISKSEGQTQSLKHLLIRYLWKNSTIDTLSFESSEKIKLYKKYPNVALKYQFANGSTKKVHMTFVSVDDFVNCVTSLASWGVTAMEIDGRMQAPDSQKCSALQNPKPLVPPTLMSKPVGTSDMTNMAISSNLPFMSEYSSSQNTCSNLFDNFTVPNFSKLQSLAIQPQSLASPYVESSFNMLNSYLSQMETTQISDFTGSTSGIEFSQRYESQSQSQYQQIEPLRDSSKTFQNKDTRKRGSHSASPVFSGEPCSTDKSFNVDMTKEDPPNDIFKDLRSYIITRLKDKEFLDLVGTKR